MSLEAPKPPGGYWRRRLGEALIGAGRRLFSDVTPAGGDGGAAVAAPDPPEAPTADRLKALFYGDLETQTVDDLVEFVEFTARFRRHSIFNARLIQTQRGAMVVASAREWKSVGRYVVPDARPIIILMPFRPVVHVYEVSDTGPALDRAAMNDVFAVTGPVAPETIATALDRLDAGLAASRQFAISIKRDRLGFALAGTAAAQGMLALPLPDNLIGKEHERVTSEATAGGAIKTPKGKTRLVPGWRVKVNDRMTPAEQLVTVAHELGHIFCGHVGACEGLADSSGWPYRGDLSDSVKEMEAEAVAWLIATRAGLTTKSADYLRHHVKAAGGSSRVDVTLVERATSRIEHLAGLRYAKAEGSRA